MCAVGPHWALDEDLDGDLVFYEDATDPKKILSSADLHVSDKYKYAYEYEDEWQKQVDDLLTKVSPDVKDLILKLHEAHMARSLECRRWHELYDLLTKEGDDDESV